MNDLVTAILFYQRRKIATFIFILIPLCKRCLPSKFILLLDRIGVFYLFYLSFVRI